MRRRAFTLVELLVTLAVLMIVLSSIYGVFATTTRNLQTVEAQADLTQTARVVLGDLRRELGSVYPMWVPLDEEQRAELGSEAPEEGVVSFAGEDAELRDGEPGDNVRFTAAVSGADEGGRRFDLCELMYFIDEDEETEERGLVRQCNYRPGLGVDEDLEQEIETREVTPLATALDLQYWSGDEEVVSLDPDGDGWIDGWSDPATLPLAIKVTIGLTPPREGAQQRTYTMIARLPIRVPKPELRPAEETGGEPAPEGAAGGMEPGGEAGGLPELPGGGTMLGGGLGGSR